MFKLNVFFVEHQIKLQHYSIFDEQSSRTNVFPLLDIYFAATVFLFDIESDFSANFRIFCSLDLIFDTVDFTMPYRLAITCIDTPLFT